MKECLYSTTLDQTIFAMHRGLELLEAIGSHLNDDQWFNGPLESLELNTSRAIAHFQQAHDLIRNRRNALLRGESLPPK